MVFVNAAVCFLNNRRKEEKENIVHLNVNGYGRKHTISPMNINAFIVARYLKVRQKLKNFAKRIAIINIDFIEKKMFI